MLLLVPVKQQNPKAIQGIGRCGRRGWEVMIAVHISRIEALSLIPPKMKE
jgi:hypothetical protein